MTFKIDLGLNPDPGRVPFNPITNSVVGDAHRYTAASAGKKVSIFRITTDSVNTYECNVYTTHTG